MAALEKVRGDRDIVLIDQRGTGESNPLRCPVPDDFAELMRTPSPEDIERYTLECLEQGALLIASKSRGNRALSCNTYPFVNHPTGWH